MGIGPTTPPAVGIKDVQYDDKTGKLKFVKTDNSVSGPFNVRGTDAVVDYIQLVNKAVNDQTFVGKIGDALKDKGVMGPAGAAAPVGLGISDALYNSTEGSLLFKTTNDNISYGPFNVRGATGPAGAKGPAGLGISDALYNSTEGSLMFKTTNDNISYGPFNVRGATGPAGLGISDAVYNNSEGSLLFKTTNDNISYGPFNVRGPQGAPRTQGPQGTMGPIGLTGPAGAMGTMGPIGLTGLQGPPGAMGTMGPIGLGIADAVYNRTTGNLFFRRTDNSTFGSLTIPAGAAGTMGPIGLGIADAVYNSTTRNVFFRRTDNSTIGSLTISQGPAGAMGTMGPIGLMGPTGISDVVYNSTTGNLFFRRSDNSTFGSYNIRGPQGQAGVMGTMGPIGLTGPTGISDVVYNSTTGNLFFRRGDNSSFGSYNIRGPQGLQGVMGTMGPIGLTGPTGISDVVYNSTTGNLFFRRGDNSTFGSCNIRGPQGIIGLTGPAGPIGTMGPIGLTGPTGISDVVYNSTTGNLFFRRSDNSTFGSYNIRGPQGLIGTMGPIGLTGPAGPGGTPGLQGAIGPTGPAGNIQSAENVTWLQGRTMWCADGSCRTPLNHTARVDGNVGIRTTSAAYNLDVWSGQGFDETAGIRLYNNSSQYGRTQLHLVGRFEDSNDAWSRNPRNAIVFSNQTSKGGTVNQKFIVQNFNDSLGILNGSGDVLTTWDQSGNDVVYNSTTGNLFFRRSDNSTFGSYNIRGPQGLIGTMGPIGLTGPAGPGGTPGLQGAIGPTGPAGNIQSAENVTWLQGRTMWCADGSCRTPLNHTARVDGNVGIRTTSAAYNLDVWSGQGFDETAGIRLYNNSSQYGRTQLHLVGRFEDSNDAWSRNPRNAIVFSNQTSKGGTVNQKFIVQNFNDSLGILNGSGDVLTTWDQSGNVNVNRAISFGNSNGDKAYWSGNGYKTGIADWGMYHDIPDNKQHVFKVNNTDRMKIGKDSIDVGGALNVSGPLIVNGRNILAELDNKISFAPEGNNDNGPWVLIQSASDKCLDAGSNNQDCNWNNGWGRFKLVKSGVQKRG